MVTVRFTVRLQYGYGYGYSIGYSYLLQTFGLTLDTM